MRPSRGNRGARKRVGAYTQSAPRRAPTRRGHAGERRGHTRGRRGADCPLDVTAKRRPGTRRHARASTPGGDRAADDDWGSRPADTVARRGYRRQYF